MTWISSATYNKLLNEYHELKSRYAHLSFAQNELKQKHESLERKVKELMERQQRSRQEVKSLKRDIVKSALKDGGV